MGYSRKIFAKVKDNFLTTDTEFEALDKQGMI